MGEETGLGVDDVEIVDEHSAWVAYEFPEHVRRAASDSARCNAGSRSTPAAMTFSRRPTGSSSSTGNGSTRAWLVERVVEFRRDAYRTVLLAG